MGYLGFQRVTKVLENTHLDALENRAIFKVDKIETFFKGLKTDITIAQNYHNIKVNFPIMIRFSRNRTHSKYTSAKRMLDNQLRILRTEKFFDVMLVNPEGKIVYASDPSRIEKDLDRSLPDPDGRAFKNGKEKIYFSDIFWNKAINNYGMLLTAPAHDFKGKFIGIIAFEIDMNPIYHFIQDTTGLGQTGQTLIGKKIKKGVLFLNPLRHDPDAALKKTVIFGEEYAIPMQRAVVGQNGRGLAMGYRHRNVIAAWRYIPLMDWGLVEEMDATEAFSFINKSKIQEFLIMGLIGLVLVCALLFDINFLTKMTTDLKNAEKKLTEEMHLKSEFISMVSHELRVPLRSIIETICLLREGTVGTLTPRQDKLLEMAKQNLDRLERLTNDVLNFQKLEEKHKPLKFSLYNINDLIRQTIESYRIVAEKAGLKLKAELAENLPLVNCDKDKLIQVVSNLISNAIKFTKMGEIRITTALEGNCVKALISDTGIGIKKEDYSKIFKTFGRIVTNSTLKIKGTGLGLAISKKIIEEHKGVIGFDSCYQKGSTFYFTLPIAEEKQWKKAA